MRRVLNLAQEQFELIDEPIPDRPEHRQEPPLPRQATAQRPRQVTADSGTLVLSLNDAHRQLRKLGGEQRSEQPDRQMADVPRLQLCGDCGYFIKMREQTCPFCGADVAQAARRAQDAH